VDLQYLVSNSHANRYHSALGGSFSLITKKGKLAILTALTVIAAIFFTFKMIIGRERETRGFPIPPVGAYVGEIKLKSQAGDNSSTFYLERLREGDTLLVIFFFEGFQPQTLFPERLLRAEGEELYRPIIVKSQDAVLRLSGVKESDGLRGIVKTGNGVVGEWNLRMLSAGELKKQDFSSEDLQAWLKARERARVVRLGLESARERKLELAERILVLERSLADESALRTRAMTRKKELEELLVERKKSREELSKSVESLASELDLLSRITKRGQTVMLERRILQRENRWYEVNWQSDEEIGQEEIPAAEAGIDIAKFEQAVRQARETKALLREREEELRRIRTLQDGAVTESEEEAEESEESVEPGEEAPAEEPSPPNQEKPQNQENMWNRLFG